MCYPHFILIFKMTTPRFIFVCFFLSWSPSNPARSEGSGSVELDMSESSSWQQYFQMSDTQITLESFLNRAMYFLSPSVDPRSVFLDRHDHIEIDSLDGGKHQIKLRPHSTPSFSSLPASPFLSQKFWRSHSEFFPSGNLPLSGLRVAIDPGHIGGEWAKSEGRLFIAPCGSEITEGDMTLRVAKILSHLLSSAGAKVYLTRSGESPLAGADPSLFRARAILNLKKSSRPASEIHIQRESKRILLQTAEIEARARIVNERIRPDVAVCLHFNAEPWGSPTSPKLSKNNHFHILIGGHYLASETSDPEQVQNLARRILEGVHLEEVPLAKSIAREIVRTTGLPPFSYGKNSSIASPVEGTPYVWKRNLMATRLFHCPVVFLEPFVMNNGDFVEAVKRAKNSWRVARSSPDVYEQYAWGVYMGILSHYGKTSRLDVPLQNPHSPFWLDNDRS